MKAPPAATQPASPELAGGAAVAVLALMMLAVPALGVPSQELLQGTLKSILVSFSVLGAGAWFCWRLRLHDSSARWHLVVLLPLVLAAYAMASMAWSHPYLAGVEAVRWFIVGVLVWLGVNTLARERLPMLALGVHTGAVVAALWAVLQFWFDVRFLPQGQPPASSFGNRNFFAEYAVVALPFSAMLLASARARWQIVLLAATSGVVVVAVMATGTRAALVALLVEVLAVFPLVAWSCRRQLALGQWDRGRALLALTFLLATVFGLGAIPNGNPKIAEEGRGSTALERAFKRTGSISTSDTSLGVRIVMWKATTRMIREHPLAGVGAGGWEKDIPLYQAEGSQVEEDLFAHNEYLQLTAEYGLVGIGVLALMLACLLRAAWRTSANRSVQALAEAPWRAMALSSLLALAIVSNVGFAWHLAGTSALLALCLGILGASDARLGDEGPLSAGRLRRWNPAWSTALAAGLLGCAVLAVHVTRQAVVSESRIMRAVGLALAITKTGDDKNPQYGPFKAEVLQHIKAGIDISSTNRRTIPIVGDELARWGDWKNATWVWESVLSSHPYVVTLLTNVARGYSRMQQPERAMTYLERARKVQPNAATVKALDIILLTQLGQDDRAQALARDALDNQLLDYDMLNAAYTVAARNRDYATALRAMDLRLATWPDEKPVEAYVRLGNMYDAGPGDKVRALEYFQRAGNLTPPFEREDLYRQIPAAYAAMLR